MISTPTTASRTGARPISGQWTFDQPTRQLRFGACLCMVLWGATPGHAAGIFTCSDTAGERVFTHHDCPLSHPVRELYNPDQRDTASTFAPPALSAGEKQTLERLQRRLASRPQIVRGSTGKVAARQQGCAASVKALKAIRAQRRKGYALADAARLDARELALKAQRNNACY